MTVLQLLAFPIHDLMPPELEERARLVLRIQVHRWLRAVCFLSQKNAAQKEPGANTN
jgi:hypothetical protein